MTDIKISFLISVIAHSVFFLSLSLLSFKSPRIYYIPVQIIGVSGNGSVVNMGNEKNISKASAKKVVTEREVIKPGEIVAAKSLQKTEKKKNPKEPDKEKETPSEGSSAGDKASASSSAAGTGGGGIGVSVDSGNFPYVGYINILRNKVAENWAPAPYAYSGVKKVLVYFSISKNGSVDKMSVKETSGVSYIDRSAIRAVKNSSPFPPLPSGFPDDYLGVYFMFELSGG